MGFSQEEGWTMSVTKERIKYIMNTAPQAVTERYVSNLVTNGRNREFDIDIIEMRETVIEGTLVGYYFEARVLSKTTPQNGRGATLSSAVRNALTKHGVTFR